MCVCVCARARVCVCVHNLSTSLTEIQEAFYPNWDLRDVISYVLYLLTRTYHTLALELGQAYLASDWSTTLKLETVMMLNFILP